MKQGKSSSINNISQATENSNGKKSQESVKNDSGDKLSLKEDDKEQKYTTRRDIVNYNENSYNKRGWAILHDVLGKNETALF